MLQDDDTPATARSAADKTRVLRNHPLFRDLGTEALDQLCHYAKKRTFKRGATIFAKGDRGQSLFFIISGTVKIGVSSADGRGAIFNMVDAGEMFGEIAVLDGLARTADAIANADCELFVIDRRDFLALLASQPVLATKVIELLCVRLRWISEHVEQVIFPDLSGRLAKALIRLIDRPGAALDRKITITQQEIGEMLGMSRESVNKQLHEWADRKLVRLQRGSITVIDVDSLKGMAERSQD
ncbi:MULTISPECIES: Crp/Fnr family transcriptional regulator [unclassified Afipia]|nr:MULTISPECIES: Crp/Fnr family transcriptional regulator [unclassified Afipia]